MPDIIQLLPDSLANQIAAGEVVQRPASVVKELLENSIDSGATKIQVVIGDSGKGLIQVIDNGTGMTETDARLCLERHATSKIKTSEDLFNILTLGFRGEALASIAAVSKVELKTRDRISETGTEIIIEASELIKQTPVACNPGTTISVKNLFYNIPARRNFLKSNPVEMRHIHDEFQRIALAYPGIEFSLFQNDLEVYHLPTGKLSQRIKNIFGDHYREQLASCKEETEHINVLGYIGKPEHSKKTRGEQFFFVNNRYIRNNYLNHAVMNAYQGLIQEKGFPFYVLFLSVDPASIDCNVHPTKTEIKFHDERLIYGVVRSAVKQALATHNLAPSLDFDSDINFNTTGDQINKEDFSKSRFVERAGSNWESLLEGLKIDPEINEENQKDLELRFESEANKISLDEIKEDFSARNQVIAPFQIHTQFIGKQVRSGIIIIDQQAAHERILYERFAKNLSREKGISQQSLFPQTIDLNISDFSLVMEMKDEIELLGFRIEEFGKSSIIINGIPADVPGVNEKELFEGLIEQYKFYKSELSLDQNEILARSLAKRTSIKKGQKLSAEEMAVIIDQLFGCTNRFE